MFPSGLPFTDEFGPLKLIVTAAVAGDEIASAPIAAARHNGFRNI
jgi:hypothetical protein